MNRRLFVFATALTVILAACGDASDSPLAPTRPSYDGGFVVGGNNTEPVPTTTSTTTTAPSDTTSRSGGFVVGGN